jgi:hypothetical protein
MEHGLKSFKNLFPAVFPFLAHHGDGIARYTLKYAAGQSEVPPVHGQLSGATCAYTTG